MGVSTPVVYIGTVMLSSIVFQKVSDYTILRVCKYFIFIIHLIKAFPAPTQVTYFRKHH